MGPRTLCLVAVICLSGCVSISEQKERLAAAKPCCKSPAEFKYKSAPASGEMELDLSEEAPVFEFGSGRSFFAAIGLNPQAVSGKLRLKMGITGGSSGTVLCPSITFLNAQHEPIELRYQRPLWQAPGLVTNGFFFADYELPPGAAFVVVHSEAKRIGEHLSLVTRTYNPAFGAITLLFPGGPTETSFKACAPAGSVLFTYAPA